MSMSSLKQKFNIVLRDKRLRTSIGFTLLMLIAFRFLASIPVPGVNPGVLAQFLESNQFFSFLNLFSGGGLSQLSIIVLGVGPYITSSIIMQLMTTVSPKLKRLFQLQLPTAWNRVSMGTLLRGKRGTDTIGKL